MTEFGPTGASVYRSRYARKKTDGTRETWPETVRRVVDGNLGLVSSKYHTEGERDELVEMIENFQVIPAGRHLSASGVPGRQFLFNCHVSGWGTEPWEHFEFTFLRLMEGGGVGANYSNRFLSEFSTVKQELDVHIVCDPDHPDYTEMSEAGLLSSDYSHEWPGAYPVEDSREGWAAALADLLSTYYREDVRYGSRVYDVSRVRAKGEPLRQFGGTASGPAPLAQMLHETSQVMNRHRDERLSGMGAMEIDHAIAQCVVSGGVRRSARMSIMHWNDPEIVSFLICKENTGKHWTTNISVEVDAEFWNQVSEGNTWASAVLESISTGMLRDGEPGIWDSFLSNDGEPDGVIATNPCGEIALEEWENCNLGHINLSAFVDKSGTLNAGPVIRAHRLMTRFLIRATYGDVRDSKQAETLAKNRRIGVGHFGFAGMIAKMGIKYSEVPEHETVKRILDSLCEVVQSVSADYSHHLRIPAPVKTTTVAPTGTIAKLPGASEGIHPIFSRYFLRRVRMSSIDEEDQRVAAAYADDGFNVEPCQYAPNTDVISIPTRDLLLDQVSEIHGEEEAHRIVESAGDLTVVDMLRVQAMYQEIWADNAVSYTANVDPEKYSAEDLSAILREFGGQVKGFTVFPELSRPQSPYERITKEDYERAYATEVADGVDEECASGACPVV